ncbi:hypothetical protein QA601_12145, partial [Chitinispirillales bacterium ANBcel5]|uniref:hypothetical protein n=1 Tax=Cellulosispirillum alkaliphilum TaxID=3039283 RepID=UPI002A554A86|nr:hypothetical protein [Chitinispirillales bacterium ANBcel5]
NVPNPMRMGEGTRFYFHHSDVVYSRDVQLEIRIYTLGGRLIRVIRDPENGYLWDGRDQAGNVLTPNVYLYQVKAHSEGFRKTTTSDIKRLVVHPPR